MRAGFRVVENQDRFLEEQTKRQLELEKIPELSSQNNFAEIGSTKASTLASALSKPIFKARIKTHQEVGLQQTPLESSELEKRPEPTDLSNVDNSTIKKIKIPAKKMNKATLSFQDD